MTRMSRTERTALCDTALQVGEDQPTLCEGWTVKDLVVHLLVREGGLAAAGIVLKPLAGLTAAESRRLARRDFTVLVERLRGGPPRWSPYAVPRVDALLNTLEMFVHHEDVRRAQPTWTPRELTDREQRLLWKQVRVVAKRLTRKVEVGVTLERSDSGARTVVHEGTPMVSVRGLPSELALFVFGRVRASDVELFGDAAAVATLRGTDLGV
ncbi:MAG: TIGR03085 family metal-binding protein [Nocardioidaceae bacterium]